MLSNYLSRLCIFLFYINYSFLTTYHAAYIKHPDQNLCLIHSYSFIEIHVHVITNLEVCGYTHTRGFTRTRPVPASRVRVG